jgi:hypothetical protein
LVADGGRQTQGVFRETGLQSTLQQAAKCPDILGFGLALRPGLEGGFKINLERRGKFLYRPSSEASGRLLGGGGFVGSFHGGGTG